MKRIFMQNTADDIPDHKLINGLTKELKRAVPARLLVFFRDTKNLLSAPRVRRNRKKVCGFLPLRNRQIFNSPSLISSTTACARPFTFNFCITLDMWFLTVFSLINSWPAMSRVVLSCTRSSKTSRSRCVNRNLLLRSLLFKMRHPSLLGFCGLTRLRDTVNTFYEDTGAMVP